jgi:hypothetical protein
MARVIVEQVFAEPLTDDRYGALSKALDPCLQVRRSLWRRSSRSADGLRLICEFEAPDAEEVRDAFRCAGLAFERVWTANVNAIEESPELMHKLRELLGEGPSAHKSEHRSFTKPDETREFPMGKAQILNVGGGAVGRLVFEPGWRWSKDVKPLARTASCEAPHFQYHLSGKLAIRMDDGTEFIAGPGDVTALPSGHDAWVVGDEPAVVVDWCGASEYGKRGG